MKILQLSLFLILSVQIKAQTSESYANRSLHVRTGANILGYQSFMDNSNFDAFNYSINLQTTLLPKKGKIHYGFDFTYGRNLDISVFSKQIHKENYRFHLLASYLKQHKWFNFYTNGGLGFIAGDFKHINKHVASPSIYLETGISVKPIRFIGLGLHARVCASPQLYTTEIGFHLVFSMFEHNSSTE